MAAKSLIRMSIGGLLVLVAGIALWASTHTAAQGIRLRYGDTESGLIAQGGQVERWSFEGLRGDVVTIAVVPVEGDLLPLITLSGPEGTLLVSLGASDPTVRTVTFTVGLQASGAHTMTVSGASNTTGSYTVHLALEATGKAPDAAEGVLVYGRRGTGTIDDEQFRAFWSFPGTRGDVVDITMAALSGDLDSYVSLLTPQGEVLASSDGGGEGRDAALYAVRLPTTGTYTIAARRAGANFGEAGSTQGRYALTVSLRVPGSAEGTPSATELPLGQAARGRLSADVPAALYTVQAEGVIALSVELNDPAQPVSVTVMTPERAVLNAFAGLGTIQGSVALPKAGSYWVEIAGITLQPDSRVDYLLRVERLVATKGTTRALRYGQPQIAGPQAVSPLNWYFRGLEGDSVTLQIKRFEADPEGRVSLYAPDGTLLIQQVGQREMAIPLMLPMNGLYEVILEPRTAGLGYQISVEQTGLAGLAFEQISLPSAEAALPGRTGQPVEATLEPYATSAWTLDVEQAGIWHLEATNIAPATSVVLAVTDPEGHVLARAVPRPLTRTANVDVWLPQRGRYRVLIADLAGQETTTYALSGYPIEGGQLPDRAMAKGVLTPDRSYDRWTVEASPNSLLRLDVQPVGDQPAPDVFVIGADGLLLSPLALGSEEAGGQRWYRTTTGGTVQIVTRKTPGSGRVAYQIGVSALPPTLAIPSTPVPERIVPPVFVTAPMSARAIAAPQPLAVLPGEDELGEARVLQPEQLTRGEIAPGRQYQAWRFSASAGQLVAFQVIALEDSSGPDMLILDNERQVIAEQYTIGSRSSAVAHRFGAAGTYTVAVKLDEGGRYLLWASPLMGIDERVPQVLPGQAIAYGQTIRAHLIGPGDRRQFAFFGQAGDMISVRATTQQPGDSLQITLTQPDGTLIQGTPRAEAGAIVEISALRLNADGVYQISLSSTGPRETWGTLLVALHASAALSAPQGGLLEEGNTPIATLTAARTTHRWILTGQAGEQLTLQVEPLDFGGPLPLAIRLADSGGNVFAQELTQLGQGALILPDVLLPRTGIYQVIVSGGQRRTGSYRLSLERDKRGTVDIDRALSYGETVGKGLSATNYLDAWTFAGSQGDVVALTLRRVRGDVAPLSVQLRTSTGTVLGTAIVDAANARAQLESIVLPETGPYTVLVGNPDTAFEGNTAYALTLLRRDAMTTASGGVLAYGDRAESRLLASDHDDVWVFEGAAGDVITARATPEAAGLALTLMLVDTEWRTAATSGGLFPLTSTGSAAGAPAQIAAILPRDGVFALHVTGDPSTGGAYRLELERQSENAPAAGTLRAGLERNSQITPGQAADIWHYEGQAGTTVTIAAVPDRQALPGLYISLIGPDGLVLARSEARKPAESRIEGYKLPVSGSYRVIVGVVPEMSELVSGRYTLRLSETPPTGPVPRELALGSITRGLLDNATPAERWTVRGERGDTLRLRVEATSGTLDPCVQFFDAEGYLLAEADDEDGLAAELTVTLNQGASYRVVVQRYGGEWGETTGNYALTVSRVYQAGAGEATETLAYGDRVAGSVDSAQPSAAWWFAGEHGDVIRAQIQFPLDDAPLSLILRDPQGNELARSTRDRGDAVIDAFRLPASGSYVLEVRRPADAIARFSPYTLDLALLAPGDSVALAGGMLQAGTTVTGRFAAGAAVHTWLFEGQARATVNLVISPLSGLVMLALELYAPDGALVLAEPVSQQQGAFATGTVMLPLSGTYALILTDRSPVPETVYRLRLDSGPEAALSGALAVDEDRQGSITDGQPVQYWEFDGEAGTVLSIAVSAVGGDLRPALQLWGPEGRPLAEAQPQPSGSAQISRYTLPADGRYTVTVSRERARARASSGRYRLFLRREPLSPQAVQASDLALSSSVTGTLDAAGPRYYAVQLEQGDVVAVAVRVSAGKHLPELLVETETGAILPLPITRSETEASLGALYAPRRQRFILALSSTQATSYTLTVYRRPAVPAANSIVRPLSLGQTLAEGILETGATTFWQFNGQRGTVLSFSVDTTGDRLRADLTLFGPSGYIANAYELPGTRRTVLGPLRLPEDGTYQLVIGPWLGSQGGSRGSFTVRAEKAPAGESGSQGGLLLRDFLVGGGLIPEDASDSWTFRGEAGERISARVEVFPVDASIALMLAAPDGTPLVSAGPATSFGGAEIVDQELAMSGIYTLTVSANLSATAAIEYRLVISTTSSAPQAGTAQETDVSFGEQVQGMLRSSTIAQPGSALTPATPVHRWDLQVDHDGTYLVGVTRLSPGAALGIFVLDPEGVPLERTEVKVNSSTGIQVYLHSDRTYTALVTTQEWLQAISYTIALSPASLSHDGGLLLPARADIGRIYDDHLLDEWRFSGPPGTTAHLTADVLSGDLALRLLLYDPNGILLQEATAEAQGGVGLRVALAGEGTYHAVVTRAGGAAGRSAGDYRIALTVE